MAHGVVPAALGPIDDRKHPVAHRPQQGSFLAGGKRHVGMRPAPRPVIVVTIKAGRAEPILPSKINGIADAEASLLGAINEEQPAERPERLSAQALLGLLIDEDHSLAGVGKFGGGGQSGKTASHDDDIAIKRHRDAPTRPQLTRRDRHAASPIRP